MSHYLKIVKEHIACLKNLQGTHIRNRIETHFFLISPKFTKERIQSSSDFYFKIIKKHIKVPFYKRLKEHVFKGTPPLAAFDITYHIPPNLSSKKINYVITNFVMSNYHRASETKGAGVPHNLLPSSKFGLKTINNK